MITLFFFVNAWRVRNIETLFILGTEGVLLEPTVLSITQTLLLGPSHQNLSLRHKPMAPTIHSSVWSSLIVQQIDIFLLHGGFWKPKVSIS